ncbi:N-acetylglucosamine-specific PTS transporter subunit IIBC [Falsibacillus albus]|uniref:PTS sugar transporter n=1 Tax=Falsibacillus albus TaxID=2478915 RepID=A0A3L7K0X4_9BACI|nr:N-acetylglucosamine-specific PTS transporter subunit IIBC [Falsibacillus albus]RLQ96737.1 PTS sugar transporter [Falsibacillus albus]
MLGYLQRIGKALMLPIAVLPAAALLLRLGQPDLLDIKFIAASGDAIFANLALLFAIGVAIGLSKDGSGAAGLAGAVGYLILKNGSAAINESVDMKVLGGIIAGIVAGHLYNRFSETKLPDFLGFFGGKRLVPIMTALATIILALIFGFVWPPVQTGIDHIGDWLTGAGALGAGVFGFLNRLLIPFGLHHILNNIVWFSFGEYHGVTGDLSRFLKTDDPTAGTFMTGFFPVMMFGLPAAALAMIAAAKKEKRKMVTGMLLGVAFTSFLTGITEPIEFTFMFLSPVLYFIHALLMGSSLYITELLGIKDGFGFSAGFIDYAINFGIATKPLLLLVVGLVYGAVYFVVFYFMIKGLNIKTPGREDDDDVLADGMSGVEAAPALENSKTRFKDLALAYYDALGGRENIVNVDNCITRLRMKVKDAQLVNESEMKKLGAKGVMKLSKTEIQIIIGTEVEFIANELNKLI